MLLGISGPHKVHSGAIMLGADAFAHVALQPPDGVGNSAALFGGAVILRGFFHDVTEFAQLLGGKLDAGLRAAAVG